MYANSNEKYYSEWTISYNNSDKQYFDTENEMLEYLSIKENQQNIRQIFKKDYAFNGYDWTEEYCQLYNVEELLKSLK